MFWRLQRNWQADHDEEGLRQSLDLSSHFDIAQGVADAVAASDHLSGLPEVFGGVGVMGFCLGGSLAYLLAAQTKPAVTVSFYGSAVPDSLDLLDQITCPVQFHFGGSDPYIPRDQVKRVEEAVERRPEVEIDIQEDAGHAFHNHVAPMFYNPDAAERAWQLTERFLGQHLPTS
jgi:carboxymethylenebutenolidase